MKKNYKKKKMSKDTKGLKAAKTKKKNKQLKKSGYKRKPYNLPKISFIKTYVEKSNRKKFHVEKRVLFIR